MLASVSSAVLNCAVRFSLIAGATAQRRYGQQAVRMGSPARSRPYARAPSRVLDFSLNEGWKKLMYSRDGPPHTGQAKPCGQREAISAASHRSSLPYWSMNSGHRQPSLKLHAVHRHSSPAVVVNRSFGVTDSSGELAAYFRPSRTAVSADRGRRFRRTWTPFQADRGRRFSLSVDDPGDARVILTVGHAGRFFGLPCPTTGSRCARYDRPCACTLKPA